MKLKLLYEKEIPEVAVDDYPLEDEENETDLDRDIRTKKRFIHAPDQMMDGEINKTHSHLAPTRPRIDNGNRLA